MNLFAGLCSALAATVVCAEGASVSPAIERAAKTYITRDALLIAQADQMQSWNPGDEFEAARKRALVEVANP